MAIAQVMVATRRSGGNVEKKNALYHVGPLTNMGLYVCYSLYNWEASEVAASNVVKRNEPRVCVYSAESLPGLRPQSRGHKRRRERNSGRR